MDNASKALIIAGAILIAVMLISLGVLIYNRAQETAIGSLDTISTLDDRTFNAQFTTYCGADIKGVAVRTLFEVCQANGIKMYYRAKASGKFSALGYVSSIDTASSCLYSNNRDC